MHPNQAAVQMFLKAQESKDPVRLGHALQMDSVLQEPLAGELEGIHVFAWWQMLWRFRNHGVTIVSSEASPTQGSAVWKMGYTHPATRRALIVTVKSEFEFKLNKISMQRDRYSVYGFLKQAMGTQGTLLGWLPPLHWVLRSAARERLDEFESSNGIYDGNHLLPQVAKPKRRGGSIPDVGDVSFERSKDF